MRIYNRVAFILSFGIMSIGLTTFSINGKSADSISAAGSNTANEQMEASLPDSADNDAVSMDAVKEQNTGDVEKNVVPSVTPEPTKTAAPTATALPTDTPTPTPTPTPEPNVLKCEENREIHDLIVRYLDAKLKCTKEAFADIVTDVSYVDIESIQKRTEAVLSYDNVITYTKKGVGKIDYVVYYTYNIQIATINTPAVALDEVYVSIGDDGRYRIFRGELDSDDLAILKSYDSDEDVNELVEITYKLMENAVAMDENLLEFWNRIYTQ